MIIAAGEIRRNAGIGRFYRPDDRRVAIAKQIMSEVIGESVSEMTTAVLPDGDVVVRGKPFKRYRDSEYD